MADSNILISVIVPVYNVAPYLHQCIMSIIKQTYTNLEIILVDDGSSDCSASMCDEFGEMDSRVKVIHKKNGGATSARKAGIERATGAYIACVDADDWIDLNAYEIMYQEGAVHNADIISSKGYIKEYGENSTIRISNDLTPGLYQEHEFADKIFPFMIHTDVFYNTDIPLSLCTFLFKRDLFYHNQMQVDGRIRMGEDMICVWYCFLEAKSVALIDSCYYHYRQHSNSTIHIHTTDEYIRLKILYKLLKLHFSENSLKKEFVKKLDFYSYFILLLSDYKLLFEKNKDFLFPFSKVKKGSSIVVYGAGAFGQEMMTTLKSNKDYNVVLWVDREYEDLKQKGIIVESPQSILRVPYDCIVVAITRDAVAKKIKESLMDMGIAEDKIALIDIHVLTHDGLPADLI